ncbi:MAG: hypothetical protein A3G24_07200 [Betaproteobacteria bacterium RIFCSPLOWO2_12_FULL_62_13]|nr:MAG: hypothetical protein A3G24_07200 [Betaproteobacteria bacterium RIFCSPLOWO2_12_FULL_62_13]
MTRSVLSGSGARGRTTLSLVQKQFVTPAKAGVQKTRTKRINALLDAGFRRQDEIARTLGVRLETRRTCSLPAGLLLRTPSGVLTLPRTED